MQPVPPAPLRDRRRRRLRERSRRLWLSSYAPSTDSGLLTISESGFERIPLARRAEAYKANEGGWTIQTTLVAKYLGQAMQG